MLRFHIRFVVTVYCKMRQVLLQNTTAILLQNATENYYKMCEVFITKCEFYYKMRRLLKIATVHT